MIKIFHSTIVTILMISALNVLANESSFRVNSNIEDRYFKNCININEKSNSKAVGQYICYPSNGRTPLEAQKVLSFFGQILLTFNL